MTLASPGVLVKEVDFTATVQVADQNIGVVAIDAERGPTDQVTYVSSERQLVETFGNPNNNNYESWFAAATLIQYGAVVAVIRPTGATDLGLNNANIKLDGTSSTSLVIKNKDDFESTVTKDYTWAARTAGSFNNAVKVVVVDHGADQQVTATGHGLTAGTYFQWVSGSNTYKGNVYKVVDVNTIQVTLWDTTKRLTGNESLVDASNAALATVSALVSDDVYGTLEYETNRKWSSIAPQPGTSASAVAKGAKYDEFHIAVLDVNGTVSGTPGSVLETMTFVSKASDAKSAEGSTTYYKTVVKDQSEYIYPGDSVFITSGEQLALAGQVGTAAEIGAAIQSATFKLFDFDGTGSGTGTTDDSVGTLSLANGDNYSYVDSAAIASVRAGLVSGYDLVEDPELFGDIDFLVPGHISTTVVAKLIAIAEKRRDCVVVASPERSDVVNSSSTSVKTDNVIGFFRTLPSSSYAMYDSGYKYIYDKYNDVYRYVPCAADVAGLCISTTNNAETWFSPAGYNRGQIRNATKLAYSPRQAERDRLYTDRINPIVAFPGQGIVLFGDKTALASPSAFDRINVRRLFIELEKNIANFSKYQLFEINDELTRSGFRSAIEPYLRGVQGRRGIYDFLVVCDTTNNTPDVIDRNELVAEIFIKPARTINYITITFVATRTGVSFNELTN